MSNAIVFTKSIFGKKSMMKRLQYINLHQTKDTRGVAAYWQHY
ncbi:hypothetical protein [Paenibacillus sp. FSL K6-1230]